MTMKKLVKQTDRSQQRVPPARLYSGAQTDRPVSPLRPGARRHPGITNQATRNLLSPRSKPPSLRRPAEDRLAMRTRAAAALRGPGSPLPSEIQSNAQLLYGQSFADVRIHTDPQTSKAASGLRASAFTLGHDVGFAAGRYAPGTAQGQLLLHHELKHVAQQRSAARVVAPEIDHHSSTHESDAREILNPHVRPLAVQRIQCAGETEQYSIGTGFADKAGREIFGETAWPFIKAVLEGFVGGLQADVKSGRADAAKSHLKSLLVPWNGAKFYGGYLVGLVIGLVSPITDLVKGIIGLVQLGIKALEWMAKWSPVGVAVSPARQQKIAELMQRFKDLGAEFMNAVRDFAADPKGTIKKFAGLLDSLMQMALGKAREIGSKAAHSIFDFLELPYYDMGKSIGEVIGALVAQVLLLIFSDAIGNLISKGASFLGKAAEFVAGKAVQVFEWVKGFVSEVVTLLRNAVKSALKLFEGVVNKAVQAFEALAALFTEAAAVDLAGERVAAGVGRGVAGPGSNVMESRMVSAVRTSPAKVSDLTPPKVHPSNVGKPAPGKAPFDEPLTAAEKKLTPDQLRQKQILETFEEGQTPAYEAAQKETTTARGRQETGKVGAGLKAKPKHHVLPQQYRAEFERRGFTGKLDIDNLTVVLDEAEHQAIHGGGDYKLGRTTGFEWNTKVWSEIMAEEAKLGGRLLTPREVLTIVKRLMNDYKIPAKFVPYK
jgi:uncharacterized protein DUF4157